MYVMVTVLIGIMLAIQLACCVASWLSVRLMAGLLADGLNPRQTNWLASEDGLMTY